MQTATRLMLRLMNTRLLVALQGNAVEGMAVWTRNHRKSAHPQALVQTIHPLSLQDCLQLLPKHFDYDEAVGASMNSGVCLYKV